MALLYTILAAVIAGRAETVPAAVVGVVTLSGLMLIVAWVVTMARKT